MPDRHGFGPPHDGGWGPPRWGPPGRGAQAWHGFGRRMFLGGLLFVALTLAVLVGIATLVVTVVARLVGPAVPTVGVLVPLLLVLVLVLGARRVTRTWRPARQLIRAAGALADGDYSARVPPASPGAIGSAVASFNEMARRLETADEQRRRLLADLGHELRTPLTVIRGELEAMIDGVHTPDDEHLDLLLDEVGVMERLLADLRTLSLIEAGSLALHPEPTDLGSLLEDVADAHRRRAGAAGVAVSVDLDPGVGEVEVDPVRIREVLTNLVVNSLRAMPDGGSLRLAVHAAAGEAVVEVSDTGAGIPQDDLGQVFDRFHKGSTSSGSGLGLTISRDLVTAHGGSISIDSRLGAGTTVRVSLPLAQPGLG